MFWAVTEGAVAAVLLVAGAVHAEGNPLSALQTASVLSGLPFSVILALMCWALVRQLRHEHLPDAPLAGPLRLTPGYIRRDEPERHAAGD